ncbi:MAG: hypothetical protein HZA01_05735 [Nitrospinae bacterium]|nr:hypothetical protein [Nitrospinota bacterium]
MPSYIRITRLGNFCVSVRMKCSRLHEMPALTQRSTSSAEISAEKARPLEACSTGVLQ